MLIPGCDALPVPLGVFVMLVAMLAVGLTLNPREVPSPLINKPVPAFQLAQLHQPGLTFSQKDMAGQVWLLNVWASWCVACRDEHPLLVELAKSRIVPHRGPQLQGPAGSRQSRGSSSSAIPSC